MNSFALFKNPNSKTIHYIEGEELYFQNPQALSTYSGYLFSPFHINTELPLILISSNHVTNYSLEDLKLIPIYSIIHQYLYDGKISRSTSYEEYSQTLKNYLSALHTATFTKLVLSRKEVIDTSHQFNPIDLFIRACNIYTSQYVALIFTSKHGVWLTATPEILLAQQDEFKWKTMALAGTIWSSQQKWDEKNKAEHNIVCQYIHHVLAQFGSNVHNTKTYPIAAGKLFHLRTDFEFNLFEHNHLSSLIAALHPTPAVCGLPKDDAIQFILNHEFHSRDYYSGYNGIWNVKDMPTHLYVTLRCLQLYRNYIALYAGGGIMKDSIEEIEWNETAHKLQTMKECIVNIPTSTSSHNS